MTLSALILACQVFCIHEGYKTGTYYKRHCMCVDSYLFKDILEPKLKLDKQEPNKDSAWFYRREDE